MFSLNLNRPYINPESNSYKEICRKLLDSIGITINGTKPWDIQVNDESLYKYIFSRGTVGLGESYMNGLWDCENLDEFMFRLIDNDLQKALPLNFQLLINLIRTKIFNRQSVKRASDVAIKHYDIGNDLYEAMLGKRMIYSCADWSKADTLEKAQEDKLDLICRKLYLKPGLKVLDIGCGWGGFAQFAAEKYRVEVVGVTVSKEQSLMARKRCANLPVEIRLQDYRSLKEKYDRIVSIGMFEHVGYKNYPVFMNVVLQALNPNGLFLLHCIGSNHSVNHTDPWIDKYIFPNGMMPSVAQIGKATENKFILEDWHNMGLYYDRTLLEWLNRFRKAWPVLKEKYDNRFYRMWVYYLSCSAASFRAKKNNLWQIVFSRAGDHLHYTSIR